jgi:PAS domain S-box-containing protein
MSNVHRVSSERFAGTAIADAAPAAIFVIQDGRLRYVNQAFAALTGHPAADLVGRDSIDSIHPADRTHLLERGHTQQQGRSGVVRSQFRITRADGGETWVYATTAPFVYDGRAAIIGTAIDVQERRHAQDAVAKSQRLEAVGRLAGGIAHDFNNMLQVVLGHSERLLQGLTAEHALRESATQIRQSAERAARLTDRLLSLGQRQVLDPELIDLSRFVTEVRPLLQTRLTDGIVLTINAGRQTAPVRVDRSRLGHVLVHLVDNARDAMPNGGTVSVSSEFVDVDESQRMERPWLRSGPHMRLVVEDSGPGLAPGTAAHLFEPFFTTKSRGKGDGLGLATVYGLVKQSNGFIWVESNPGVGTRIVVLLPAVGAARATEERRPAAVPPVPVRPTVRPRVLMVEDEPSVRELLTYSLNRHGFEVLSVPTAEEAVPLLAKPFDILLTDISLPGMNGVQLALRARRVAPQARVLLMSGYAREEFLSGADEADDLPFIGKPFTTRAIVERLRGLLQPVPRQEARPS